ncbi:MAG: restriction endonuclease subunit S, partial [Anaerolineae bacterium]|nr:restriction endonuclease subunit S [Anaerolineae bacterium]
MNRIAKLIAHLCPDGVEFRAIGEIAECYSGATPASGIAAYWEDGSIPWMSSGEVNKGIVYDTDKKITQAGFDSCSTKMVPPNAVVMALAGQGKTRGMVARTRLSLCTNQSLCSIVCNETVNSDFLYYFLSTQYQQLRSVSAGDGTRGGLNLQMIRSFRVPVPPVEVQREIVQVLDAFTALEAELEAELEA